MEKYSKGSIHFLCSSLCGHQNTIENERKNSTTIVTTITEYRTPEKKESDLIFAVYQIQRHPILTAYMMISQGPSQKH